MMRLQPEVSVAFGRLRGIIWDQSGIRLDTKLKVYRAVVLPTLLYACETWKVYQRHAKKKKKKIKRKGKKKKKKKLKPFPLKLPAKTPKNQVARQDPGYRDPEEGRHAKRAYSFEAYPA